MNTDETKTGIQANIASIEAMLNVNRNILSNLSVDSKEYEVIYKLHLEQKQEKQELEILLASL